jgi:serine/threonine protein kinase
MERVMVEAINAVIDSKGPLPNIPYNLLLDWTDNFSENRKLGSGGFGEVFEGRFPFKTANGNIGQVAIKRLSPALQNNMDYRTVKNLREESMISFRREINVLSSFRHANIIHLVGFSYEEQKDLYLPLNLCLVYELAPLGGLNKMLFNTDTARQLDWDRRIRIAFGIACGLNYLLHSQKGYPAFHRDVKSANIVLNKDYIPKLIDCGLSKYISKDAHYEILSKTGQVFGTPGYMCPKYVNSRGEYDEKSEIYSYGIVFCELLTGFLQNQNKMLLGFDIDISKVAFDRRAGIWPEHMIKDLRQLALGCIADYNDRIATMMYIVKRLDEIHGGDLIVKNGS